MYEWPATKLSTKSGTLDEVMTIKAVSGAVEIVGHAEGHMSWTLTIPAPAVDELIRRLAAARDGAALMASQK